MKFLPMFENELKFVKMQFEVKSISLLIITINKTLDIDKSRILHDLDLLL